METVTTPETSEQTSPPRPSRRTIALIAAGVVGVAVVALLAVFALRASRDDVLPGVRLAGVDVGGLDRAQLAAEVAALADERESQTVAAELRDARRVATNADLGYRIDREATVDAVWSLGRQANPFAALADHVQASFTTTAVGPVTRIDETQLSRWATRTADELEIPPVEGDVRIAGGEVRRRDPELGVRPLVEPLEQAGRTAVAEVGPDTVQVETERVEPETTSDDVDRVVASAERVLGAPVVLRRRDETVTLGPVALSELYTVKGPARGDDPPLRLEISPDAVAEVFDEDLQERFAIEPRDADVVLTSGGPKIEEGANGFEVDVDKVVGRIDELARTPLADGEEVREGRVPGSTVEPERTTEEARALQITERVASFTTEHACCQGRVTNIHRIADIVDGTLIEPGEQFSLNGAVGPRTRAKGFVGGGAIQRGEYVEEVGGGISQFATTFFNAAYFGGYQIDEHKPHSYYISRYPVGRESTINWPNVDVKITNDSPYGILVDTSYTDTSITVTFWGREWAEVDSTTGSPHNYTSPETQYETNPDLPPGEERVIQAGGQGFDIVVTRTVRYDAGGSDTREFFTRYLAEPRIIERGPPED